MTEIRSGLPILAFANQAAFDRWLSTQAPDSTGAWIKFAKKGSGIASVTKPEAIDSALCHGWIDGQLDKYDEHCWLIRFTPRKARSKWSEVNRTRALELIAAGRMQAEGLAQIEAAKANGCWDAAYAPARSPKAAAFFATLTGANRYAVIYRIGAVKKAETRTRKIAEFVAMLERGETLHG
jgi:uncharacterized protein YdeI (YjbR/CyaY-like superfamily)